MSGDWTAGVTIDRLAVNFTPQQAAGVKADYFGLRLCLESDPELDAKERARRGSQWFSYCMGAIARRA